MPSLEEDDHSFDEGWPAEAQLLYLNLIEGLESVNWAATRDEVIARVADVCAEATLATLRDSGGQARISFPGTQVEARDEILPRRH